MLKTHCKNGKEGRCITVARARAGMSQQMLADKICYSIQAVAEWEKGRGKAKWEELYKALPELPKIRANGCAIFCEKPTYCQNGDGSCYYSKYHCTRGKKRKGPNAD